MDTREQIFENFDADGVGVMGSLFGLPFTPENSELIILPVPWEVTVSYSSGTANGPKSILEASTQVDLFVDDIDDAWKLGLTMLPISEEWKKESDKMREKSSLYIKWLEDGKPEFSDEEFHKIPEQVNQMSAQLNQWVKSQALKYITDGKMVAVLGGDHSTPLGLIEALSEQYQNFGILQIDAHADLRVAYEDFTFSHASIMYNALKCSQISKLVQVGIRDCSNSESNLIKESHGRITTFFDRNIKEQLSEGKTWRKICRNIISTLPENIYISFDIDGLDPKLCPHTGTPVPGGFDFYEIFYLIKLLVTSGKKIIGFDLCEVAPGEKEWDGNVGARVLYRLSNLMAVSQGKLKFR